MSGKIYIEFDSYEGKNNSLENYKKWPQLGLYKNLSTVWLTPTRGKMHTRVAFSWMNVMGPPNAMLPKMSIHHFEVGQAYNEGLKVILSNPILSKCQYLLTVEEDNLPQPDSLLKLYDGIQTYDAVGGLYWIKGEGGAPMIWGDIKEPGTYVPQPPKIDTLQECNGLGMGWTLFRMDMFRNPKFEFGSWFKTIMDDGAYMTQDLYFFQKAQQLGYKFACDTRVKIGHIDEDGKIW